MVDFRSVAKTLSNPMSVKILSVFWDMFRKIIFKVNIKKQT